MKWVGYRHRGLLRGVVVPGHGQRSAHIVRQRPPLSVHTPRIQGLHAKRTLRAWLSKMIHPATSAITVAPPIYDCVSKPGPCFYPIFTIFPSSPLRHEYIYIYIQRSREYNNINNRGRDEDICVYVSRMLKFRLQNNKT